MIVSVGMSLSWREYGCRPGGTPSARVHDLGLGVAVKHSPARRKAGIMEITQSRGKRQSGFCSSSPDRSPGLTQMNSPKMFRFVASFVLPIGESGMTGAIRTTIKWVALKLIRGRTGQGNTRRLRMPPFQDTVVRALFSWRKFPTSRHWELAFLDRQRSTIVHNQMWQETTYSGTRLDLSRAMVRTESYVFSCREYTVPQNSC